MPRRPLRRLMLSCAAALVWSATATPAQAQQAISFSSLNGSFLDGNTRMIGWQFTVNSAVRVEALGWFDWGQDGLNRSHEVGLWTVDGPSLLSSAVVEAGTAAPLNGYFRYTDLASAITLQPGVTYRVAGLDIGAGGDPHVWTPLLSGFDAHVNGSSYAPTLNLMPGDAIGGYADSFSFPTATIGDTRHALLGPNLMLSPVPEPATLVLLLAGLALVLRRARQSAG